MAWAPLMVGLALLACSLLGCGQLRARLALAGSVVGGVMTCMLLTVGFAITVDPGIAIAVAAMIWCWEWFPRRACLIVTTALTASSGLFAWSHGTALPSLAVGSMVGFAWAGPGLALARGREPMRDIQASESHQCAAAALAHRAGIDMQAFSRHQATGAWTQLGAVTVIGILGVWLIWRGLESHGAWLVASGVVLVAVHQAALFSWIHEAVHGMACQQRWLNEVLGTGITALGYASFTAYRQLHLKHHRHLGGPGDPDEYKNYTNSPAVRLLMHYWRLCVATLFYLPLMPIIAWRQVDQRARWRMAAELLLVVILHSGLCLALGWSWYLWLWVVPYLLATLSMNIRGLAQHVACDVDDPLLASRSITAGPVLRFLMLNENYHLEHHLYPQVPGAQLHALHHQLRPHYPRSAVFPGYLRYPLAFIAMTMRGRDELLLNQPRTPASVESATAARREADHGINQAVKTGR